MNAQIERILDLPNGHKAGIVGGVCLLIIGMFWFFSLSTIEDEISAIDSEINGVNGFRVKISQRKGMVKNLNSYTEEVADLNVELEKALLELPDKRETHLLLSRISDKATDSGLDIKLFKPQPELKKDFYAEVPVELQVIGSYHQLGSFFDEVGHMERVVNLQNFAISNPKKDKKKGVQMKSSFLATAFRFLSEKERAVVKKKSDKPKRRRK